MRQGKGARSRRSTVALKRRAARKRTRKGAAATAVRRKQLESCRRVLREALEQQTATSDVLRVISSSPTDAQPVFNMIAESAARLCEAQYCFVYRFDGHLLHFVAHHGLTSEVLEINRRSYPAAPSRRSVAARAMLERAVVQIPDVTADPDYALSAMAKAGGYASAVGVPILRDGLPIGSIAVTRVRSGLLPERQIELLKTFADQAAIAIENARLFGAEQQRTADLTDALEQQTATADVLKVISRSTFDLQTVLSTLVASAGRLCEADTGIIRTREGDTYPLAATFGLTERQREHFENYSPTPDRSSLFGRAILDARTIHVADVVADPEYDRPQLQDYVSVRAGLAVPLVREGTVVGVFTLQRREPRPYTQKQIELVETFAAQAVIAIENTRLLNELRESLQQQTATADVLKVISRSTFDLQNVLDTLVESAARLCEAEMTWIARPDGPKFRLAASFQCPPAFVEHTTNELIPGGRGTLAGRALAECRTIHIHDVLADSEYTFMQSQQKGRFRTMLGAPLLREGAPIGVLILTRATARPFSDKQIELVTTFADQAVIAIENTRLLNELRDSLEQQTATSEVLGVISSSPGDLQPVFEAMLDNASRICEADAGNLFLCEPGGIRAVAVHGEPQYVAAWRGRPLVALTDGEDLPINRIARTKSVVHIADLRTEPAYIQRHPRALALVDAAGARTLLNVPLLRDNEMIGVFGIFRRQVRPFTDKQIELVQNFAAQAVIAIENARLLNELRQRTDDLTELLEQQTATSEVLQVISSSPGELQPVFDAMLANAVRICEANFGMLFRIEDGAFRAAAMSGVPPAFAEFWNRGAQRPGPRSALGRIVDTRQTVHIADVKAEPAYVDGEAVFVAAVNLGGFRTLLNVPMLKESELIGVISIYRQEVCLFTDKQVALLTNFAAQAVIAIENARLLNELRQRTDDLSEALEQQTATSEVLRVISSAVGELDPVFEAVVKRAAGLLNVTDAEMMLREDDVLRCVAKHGSSRQWPLGTTRSLNRDWVTGRAVIDRTVVHVADLQALEDEYPEGAAFARQFGHRTALAVPLLQKASAIGAILIRRMEVNPFTDKQIAVVQNFAAQAVIAIENTRLLSELRESLQQQTATADVLKVISRSAFDLPAVLNTLLESACRLCEAGIGTIRLEDSDRYRLAATYGCPPEWHRHFAGYSGKPDKTSVFGQTIIKGATVHIPDVLEDPDYARPQAQKLMGLRAALGVPLMRDGRVFGVVNLFRTTPTAFTQRQIELAETFADQAVIAIENVRLFDAEQQRTRELSEALEQQTATAHVLDVISHAAFDLQAVFDTVVENSVRLCGADRAFLFRFDGEFLRVAAEYNCTAEFSEWVKNHPIRPGRHSGAARAALERRTIHVPDVLADPEYSYGAKDVEAIRTILGVPILKGDDLLGVIMIFHLEVRPFTDKQIAVVETFADQAAIAIENTQLLDALRLRTGELSRSVEELRALGEVSQAVNSTLDLETVLSTITAKAVQLSGTDAGAIYVYDEAEREFHLRATYGMDRELIDALRRAHIGIEEPNAALTLSRREPVQVADLRDEPASDINEITLRAGFRARLVAPLVRGEEVVGLLVVRRRTPGEFPRNTIDLLKTFAAQSVLTLQNARLFESVEARTRDLAKSLADLRTAQDRLLQTEKLASLGQLTAGIAHEIKNPLNFVNNFSGVSVELLDELRESLSGIRLEDKTAAEITELADTLRDNLEKIVQHGKRADSIVKNMLLHSREGSGEHRPVDLNALVEESLNLAYHGARAERQGFNITLQRSFDPAAGEVDVFPQEITRVLLNLISNGFYAATKRKAQAGCGFEPMLTATTRNLGDRVEIRIRDNGTGIPPQVKEKIFNPFFTTKPAGEGTGLGLSISHDIIVKQHSGTIEVATEPDAYTEFRIVLPRTAAFSVNPGG